MKILQLAVLLAVLGLVSAALAYGAPMGSASDEPIGDPGFEECMPALEDGDGLDEEAEEDIPVDEEPIEDEAFEPEFLSAN